MTQEIRLDDFKVSLIVTDDIEILDESIEYMDESH